MTPAEVEGGGGRTDSHLDEMTPTCELKLWPRVLTTEILPTSNGT
jgi:hypothetical protein